MDPEFWQARWRDNRISFHEGAPNTLLTCHFGTLCLAPGATVFAPLCGKSVDLHWLRGQGMAVIGAELSRLAVEQFFAEAGIAPAISDAGALRRYEAGGITIFAGDIFDLDARTLGPVDVIYDRAALVALPPELRPRYAAHLRALAAAAPQLLITFDYDQSLQPGPPFSVPETELRALYGPAYKLTHLEERDVPGGLKGICPAREHAWLLTPT